MRITRWRMRSRSSAMMNSVVAMVAFELVVGRHVIGGVVGEQRLPLVELPVVEQRGLVIEEILDLRARDHRACRDRHAGAPISSFQRRQKMRR